MFWKKKFILALVDTIVIAVSMGVSFIFVSEYINQHDWFYVIFFVTVMLVYFLSSLKTRIYSVMNRYLSSRDLVLLLTNVWIAYTVAGIGAVGASQEISLRYMILSVLLTSFFIIIPRMIWKELFEWQKHRTVERLNPLRTLVVGAGEGGHLFIETSKNDQSIDIIGFIDNDMTKKGKSIASYEIFGGHDDLPRVVQQYHVDQVVIAIPTIETVAYSELIDLCNRAKVRVKIMPRMEDVASGRIQVKATRDIDIADLLNRQEVKLNQENIEEELLGETILVTGAGGSIGSEICRQIIKFNPNKVILLGHGENSIYQIHKELTYLKLENITVIPVIADIQDAQRMKEVMLEYQPNYVFHAAAHKHVPLMEVNPHEAVKNNIYGTRNVAIAAKEANVKKFVMVSTDKAVNPPNVMGATKRVAEMIVTQLNEEGKTKFVAVRFGNVLGSRGSVVPLFKEQIEKGGPLTVTDFRMTRYFMTIPEASRLVIQAGVLAKGGEIFILDMGEPVKILDLAKNVIRLSGFTEEQIEIKEVGIRKGEKLYEELLTRSELVDERVFEKIFVGKVTEINSEELSKFITSLDNKDEKVLRTMLLDFANKKEDEYV